MQQLEETSTPYSVAVAIVTYSLCSSTMLLANKMALYYLPSPPLVSFFQIIFAVVAVFFIKSIGHPVDKLELSKVKAYGIFIVIFLGSLVTNMKALSVSSIETVIVFRSCAPIAVSIVEYCFMDREFSSLRSVASLLGVAVGAMMYCLSDSQLALNGISSYFWVSLYFVFITVDMTYGKQIISTVKMESVWGPVLYQNILSVPPMFVIAYGQGAFNDVVHLVSNISNFGVLVLLFSCVAGTLIGYTSWLCRGMLSATSFTLIGVANKFLTVLLNLIVWDKHSTPFGIFSVCVCLSAGFFYQQAPKRIHDKSTTTTSSASKTMYNTINNTIFNAIFNRGGSSSIRAKNDDEDEEAVSLVDINTETVQK